MATTRTSGSGRSCGGTRAPSSRPIVGRFTPRPFVDGRLVGRPHRDYIAYYPDQADPLYITELADPTDRFDVRWYDPVTGLSQVEVRPGGAQEFRAPGRGSWVLHIDRHELPPGRWLDESFDLPDGLLAGQHAWSRVADNAQVAGGAAVLHAERTAIAVDHDVEIQQHGRHRLDFRVQVASGTATTIAKLEVSTLRSPVSALDDDKFQIQFGGDRFRINRIGIRAAGSRCCTAPTLRRAVP